MGGSITLLNILPEVLSMDVEFYTEKLNKTT